MAAELRPGVAVELPEGVFNVVGQQRYSALALQWWVWDLEDGSGGRRLLARVDRTYYQPTLEECEALPEGDTVEVRATPLRLRGHGEARVERSGPDGTAFWLARFRYYAAGPLVALYSLDRGQAHRLTGEARAEGTVQVFEG